ncbi:hypothetical protein B0J18DRAFT_364340 [Chaetomium sp. MPI-SDFR-AT-0129]|nr:hypothetical protein B0J18DRAFT_364340 [Chaetomium sp. MPI-SDFR-AT-0129]
MRFTSTTALAILAYVSGALASPITTTTTTDSVQDLVPIGTETINGIDLVWYGAPEPSSANPHTRLTKAAVEFANANANTKRDCGTNDVKCSGSHKASNGVCQALLSALKANGGNTVSRSPRAVCQGQNNNQCCASWSVEVDGNLLYGDLYDAANKVIGQCNSGGSVSGLARNVNLAGTCATQCLSNRANGCS